MTEPSERRGSPRAAKWLLKVRGTVRKNLEIVLGANIVWSTAFVGVVALLLASQRCGQSLADVDSQQPPQEGFA